MCPTVYECTNASSGSDVLGPIMPHLLHHPTTPLSLAALATHQPQLHQAHKQQLPLRFSASWRQGFHTCRERAQSSFVLWELRAAEAKPPRRQTAIRAKISSWRNLCTAKTSEQLRNRRQKRPNRTLRPFSVEPSHSGQLRRIRGREGIRPCAEQRLIGMQQLLASKKKNPKRHCDCAPLALGWPWPGSERWAGVARPDPRKPRQLGAARFDRAPPHCGEEDRADGALLGAPKKPDLIFRLFFFCAWRAVSRSPSFARAGRSRKLKPRHSSAWHGTPRWAQAIQAATPPKPTVARRRVSAE